MLTNQQFQSYCQGVRLDYAQYSNRIPSLDVLTQFQQAQLISYPFQSLSTVLREPIQLEDEIVFQKIVMDQRGGYCYELNGLFQSVLRYLGFDVETLSAYIVHDNNPALPKAKTHTLLKVNLNQQDYLVDVGFGGLVPTIPLKLEANLIQHTPHGRYQLTRFKDKYVLSTEVKGQWKMLYAFDLNVQNIADLEVGNWFVSTHPHSPFRTRLMLSRIEANGIRHNLLNTRYQRHQLGKASESKELNSLQALFDLLSEVFFINISSIKTTEKEDILQRFLFSSS